MKVIRANYGHLKQLVPLFDAYRVFYEQESDLEGAFEFLKARCREMGRPIGVEYAEGFTVAFKFRTR